jgi:transposase
MRILQLQPHLTTSELTARLSTCSNLHHRGYWQILLSVSFNPNKKAEEYASFLGFTKSKIYKVVELYNKNGADFTSTLNWGGRRNTTSHMSFEEEQNLMNDLAVFAVNGNILVAKHIRELIEKKLGKPVSEDYIWDLFKRHNWKKKMPRPEHPKKNKEAQEEFKKNSLKYRQPTN